MQLAQDAQPVESRQQQVEDDEVVRALRRASQRVEPVQRGVDREALGLEAAREEREDPRLVLDDQDPHSPPRP